jgi:hypothetical protein
VCSPQSPEVTPQHVVQCMVSLFAASAGAAQH